jgi:hypothetical protein
MAYGASGWSMYMFRNYSPRLGRWTQRDPIGLGSSLNLYAFCRNAPVGIVDCAGREPAKADGQKAGSNVEQVAKTVYAETRGLRPQWDDPNGPRTEENYDPESKRQLCEARRRIAGIAASEPGRCAPPVAPPTENKHAQDVYQNCTDAAADPISPGETRHFWMGTSSDGGNTPDKPANYDTRKESDKWPWTQSSKITHTYGPFRNQQTGRDTYIWFYTGVK